MRKIVSVLIYLLIAGNLFAQGGVIGTKGVVGPKGTVGYGAAASVTWTLVQHPHNFACTTGTTGNLACTVTNTGNTTAGNAGILLMASVGVGNAGTFVSATSGDGTWVHPAGCGVTQTGGGEGLFVDCAYLLNLTGGTGSEVFTVNFTSASFNAADVCFLEVHRSTGTATFDTANHTSSASCGATTCTGVDLTAMAGASDYLATGAGFGQSFSSISGAYSNPFDIDNAEVEGACAGALNQTVGTAPTWTMTGGASEFAAAGIALK